MHVRAAASAHARRVGELRCELEGCGGHAAVLAGAVVVLPGEGAVWRRGRAQHEGEDGVNVAEHGVLGGGEGGGAAGRGAGVLREAPQLEALLAELGGEEGGHLGRGGGVDGVWVEVVREEAVLGDKVGDHVPLAAVADGGGKELLDEAAVEGVGGGVEHALEEVVGLLQLVPEEEVGLAELEVGEVVFAHERDAEYVGGGEEPAAARGALVGYRAAFLRDGDVEGLRVGDGGGAGGDDGGGWVVCECREGEAVLWWGDELLVNAFGSWRLVPWDL